MPPCLIFTNLSIDFEAFFALTFWPPNPTESNPQSFVKFRRVPTVIGSARTSYLCVAAAVLATVLSAVFWNGILITGGYFWVSNNDNVSLLSKYFQLS